jgi:putative ABC transport system permease protein
MIRNYIKIAFRTLAKNLTYSFINIAGLAVGLTAFIIIFLWIQDELSYDRFNANADRLHRVIENQYYANSEIFPVAVTPAPLGPYLKENFPEISDAVRLNQVNFLLQYEDISFNEDGLMADPAFINMFSVEFIKGDPKKAFSNSEGIIISETLAKKFFGEEDPIGNVFRINDHDFNVTGMFRDIPENSHLRFHFIFDFEFMKKFGWNDLTNWTSNSLYTYVLLRDDAVHEELNLKIKDVIKKNAEEDTNTEIYLQPLTKIHLYSAFTADIGGHGDIQYIYIFSVAGIFVLLIACINFMNLSTARSAKRSKEVGMRKVIGAQRIQLIRQFLTESIVLSWLALVIALVLIEFLIPSFNNLSGKQLDFNPFSIDILLILFLITIVTGTVAGSYPALFLSSFKPVRVLKGTFKTGKGALAFRKVLVITQFCISILLITGMIVIYNQLDFIQNKKLGFQKKDVLSFSIYPLANRIEEFKNELLANKNIVGVTSASNKLTYVGNSSSGFDWEGRDPNKVILLHQLSVDFDFIKTFDIDVLFGRAFSREIPSDSSAVILNEEAAKLIDLKDPVNKRWGTDGKIIGIVKDFHFKSVHERIEPLILFINPSWQNLVYVRISPDNTREALAVVERTFKKFAPENPFEFTFLDDDFDRLYRAEQRTGKIFNYFAIIAIFISCLGLFGLVMFTTEQRTKEIGVRKVLGASVQSVVSLISADFIKLIIISNVVAIPVAWYMMNMWLANFAYKISIHWVTFFIAGGSSLLIAWLTIAYQSIKAAVANPVDSLRNE